MLQKGEDRGPPVSLRGWLSDVYLPALLDKTHLDQSLEAITRRLGPRAGVDDPLFGRAAGLPAIEAHVQRLSAWLLERGASYERQHFTTGVDRDVTEGVLTLTLEHRIVELPVAVVAEKRRSREVEVRVYFSTQPIRGGFHVRPPLVEPGSDVSLPANVTTYTESWKRGDIKALVDAFEQDGTLREARGARHGKPGGVLQEFFERFLAGGAFGGSDFTIGGSADDGRTCGLEYTLIKLNGRDVPPQAALAMFERGDSGLFRAVRLYDDLET